MDSSRRPASLAEIERDNEGFLLHPDDWTPAVAEAIAREIGQPLQQEHWQIIDYIREVFEHSEMVPEARKLLRFMRSTWGPERATRRYLYQLFPTGYGQTACKIAGMRKPLKLMLDV